MLWQYSYGDAVEAAGEADHVEPGSVPSSLTCNRPTLASTRRGFAHKIIPNGVQLWRRLCSPLGVPPDDDDDSATMQTQDVFDAGYVYENSIYSPMLVLRQHFSKAYKTISSVTELTNYYQ